MFGSGSLDADCRVVGVKVSRRPRPPTVGDPGPRQSFAANVGASRPPSEQLNDRYLLTLLPLATIAATRERTL